MSELAQDTNRRQSMVGRNLGEKKGGDVDWGRWGDG